MTNESGQTACISSSLVTKRPRFSIKYFSDSNDLGRSLISCPSRLRQARSTSRIKPSNSSFYARRSALPVPTLQSLQGDVFRNTRTSRTFPHESRNSLRTVSTTLMESFVYVMGRQGPKNRIPYTYGFLALQPTPTDLSLTFPFFSSFSAIFHQSFVTLLRLPGNRCVRGRRYRAIICSRVARGGRTNATGPRWLPTGKSISSKRPTLARFHYTRG